MSENLKFDFAQAQLENATSRLKSTNLDKNKGCNNTNCFAVLNQWIKDDFTDGLIVPESASICKNNFQQSQSFKNTAELQLYLQDKNKDKLSPRFALPFDKCAKDPTRDSELAVSKYYYLANRYEKGLQNITQQIAAIDQILNTPKVLSEINCKGGAFPRVDQLCQKFKDKCSTSASTKDLTELVQQTSQKENELKKVDQSISELKIYLYGLKSARELDKIPTLKDTQLAIKQRDDLKRLQLARSLILEDYPWLDGEDYKENRSKKNSVEVSLKAQLTTNKKALGELFIQTKKSTLCISGVFNNLADCDLSELKKNLALQPEPDFIYKGTKKDFDAIRYQSLQQCISQRALDKDQTSQVVDQLAITAGLTAVTAGFGGLALGSRYLLGARLAGLEQATAVSTVFVDSIWFTSGVQEAIKQCSQPGEKLKIELNKLTDSNDQCPKFNSQLNQAKHEHNECLKNILLAGTNAIPLATATRFVKTAPDAGAKAATRTDQATIPIPSSSKAPDPFANQQILTEDNPQSFLWQLISKGEKDKAAILRKKIESDLKTGNVVDRKKISDVIDVSGLPGADPNDFAKSNPTFLKLDNGLIGIWKPYSNKFTYAGAEESAYLIDQQLGLNFIPITVSRDLDGQKGTLQIIVNQLDHKELAPFPDHLSWFDSLIGNTDRHGGNYLTQNGKVIGIDHGLSFKPDTDILDFKIAIEDAQLTTKDSDRLKQRLSSLKQDLKRSTENIQARLNLEIKKVENLIKHLPPPDSAQQLVMARNSLSTLLPDKKVYQKLKETTDDEWRKTFSLKLSTTQVNAFLKRKQEIVAEIDALVKKYGESIFSDGPYSPLVRTPQ